MAIILTRTLDRAHHLSYDVRTYVSRMIWASWYFTIIIIHNWNDHRRRISCFYTVCSNGKSKHLARSSLWYAWHVPEASQNSLYISDSEAREICYIFSYLLIWTVRARLGLMTMSFCVAYRLILCVKKTPAYVRDTALCFCSSFSSSNALLLHVTCWNWLALYFASSATFFLRPLP